MLENALGFNQKIYNLLIDFKRMKLWSEMTKLLISQKTPPGRPRLRWRDNVANDLKTMSYKMSTNLMIKREGWKHIGHSAKIHDGL